MHRTTDELLATPLAERVQALLVQGRRFPIVTDELDAPLLHGLRARGVVRTFLDRRELWVELTDRVLDVEPDDQPDREPTPDQERAWDQREDVLREPALVVDVHR